MGSVGENDRLTIVNTLFANEEFMLDGLHLFYPASWPEHRKRPVDNMEEALALGVPVAHTSNAFVKQFRGASWLKKGVPADAGMDRIPRRPGAEQVYQRVIVVSGGDRSFARPPPTYSPITDGKVQVRYVPDRDRDVNGLGLLYFANYPAVLDYAERQTLPHQLPIAISDELLDRRTLINRKSAYISNLVPPDAINVSLEAWMENPFLASEPEPGTQPVRLFLNYQMFRESDGRKMMVSTAEKLLYGTTLEEAELIAALERSARAQGTD
jgi:probable biosynthetic protein (TIGR04098 family)